MNWLFVILYCVLLLSCDLCNLCLINVKTVVYCLRAVLLYKKSLFILSSDYWFCCNLKLQNITFLATRMVTWTKNSLNCSINSLLLKGQISKITKYIVVIIYTKRIWCYRLLCRAGMSILKTLLIINWYSNYSKRYTFQACKRK